MFPLFIFGLVAALIVWMAIEPMLHEAAHFLAAKMVGFSPFAVTVGKGRVLFQRRIGDVDVRVNLLPGFGMVKAVPPLRGTAWKGAIFSIAGIVCDVVLLGAFLGLAGLNAGPSDHQQNGLLNVSAASLALYQFVVIVLNASPRDVIVDGIRLANDGKQFIRFLSGGSGVEDYERTIATYDPLFRMDQSWLVRSDPRMLALRADADLDLASGRHASAVEKIKRLLHEVIMHPAEKAALLDRLACVLVIQGDKSFLASAQDWARQAYELFPSCKTLRGTLGSVLVEAGQYAHGLELLVPLTSENNSAVDKTLAACFGAKALRALGRDAEAHNMMQVARTSGLFAEVCSRVESELLTM